MNVNSYRSTVYITDSRWRGCLQGQI